MVRKKTIVKKPRVRKKKGVHDNGITNPGGRPEELTPKEIMAAYTKSKGFKSVSARMLNCTVATLLNYEKKYPEIREHWVHEVKAQRDDYAEGQLFALMEEKNPAAIIFYHKTQMKDRGYTEQDNSAKFIIQNINKIDLEGLSDEQLRRLAVGEYSEVFRGAAIKGKGNAIAEGTEAIEVIE